MHTKKIFIKLLNEGADVWRPVEAEKISDEIFQIIDDGTYDPDIEEWEFLPGSKVYCQLEEKSNGKILIAKKLVK